MALLLALGFSLTDPAVMDLQISSGPIPDSVTEGGITYTRLIFQGDYLDELISSQPLYG